MKVETDFIMKLIECDNPIPIIGEKLLNIWLNSANEKEVKIGTPFLKGAEVKGEVTEVGKDKKVIIFKYRAKKRYQKKQGHRQPFTKVKITEIKA